METFFTYMPYFCVAYGAFHIGKHWTLYQFSQNLSKDPDRMIEMLNQIKTLNDQSEVPEDAVIVQAEEVNGMVYAYDKLTGDFLAQGQNLIQAIALATTRFPGKKFWHPDLKQDSQIA
jgi:sialic acid synthase SpsE